VWEIRVGSTEKEDIEGRMNGEGSKFRICYWQKRGWWEPVMFKFQDVMGRCMLYSCCSHPHRLDSPLKHQKVGNMNQISKEEENHSRRYTVKK
jgi:hypothetical protein